jgi:glycosyltransferase involved in cell wall biosynthesis
VSLGTCESETSYVVPPEDADRLAERLLDLADAERARVMGEAGHHRFLERYTWPAVARRVVEAVRQRLRAG